MDIAFKRPIIVKSPASGEQQQCIQDFNLLYRPCCCFFTLTLHTRILFVAKLKDVAGFVDG
jgi:hypothetical protein